MKKAIGIIGGMGPLATCDLFHKIIDITDAEKDQNHIRVCIDNNTEIPDRTAAILHGGADPLPEMRKSAIRLQDSGANVIIMPCNTAHYFYPEITPYIDVPFLNMIEETAKLAKRKGYKKVGLLATDGTCQTGVYKSIFDRYEIDILQPVGDDQTAVMDVIYKGVKAGNLSLDLTGFNKTMDHLFDQGAEVLILGCTELPVAFDIFHINRPNLDPTLALAAAAVRFVGANVKTEFGY